MRYEFKIDPYDVKGLNMLIQRYNDALAEDDLEEVVAAGTCLEHGLAHLHIFVVNCVDDILKKLEVDDILKKIAEGVRR